MGGSSDDGHYARLLKRSPAGVLITTYEGEILAANQSAAEALGYAASDALVGQNVRDRYHNRSDRKALPRRARAGRGPA